MKSHNKSSAPISISNINPTVESQDKEEEEEELYVGSPKSQPPKISIPFANFALDALQGFREREINLRQRDILKAQQDLKNILEEYIQRYSKLAQESAEDNENKLGDSSKKEDLSDQPWYLPEGGFHLYTVFGANLFPEDTVDNAKRKNPSPNTPLVKL